MRGIAIRSKANWITNGEKNTKGQYADDTFFLLDGAQSSLSQCLNTLELFGECSGLKMNTEKTKAVWLGRKRFSKDILLPDINLAWIFNEPFEILGITFFRNAANSRVQLQNKTRRS